MDIWVETGIEFIPGLAVPGFDSITTVLGTVLDSGSLNASLSCEKASSWICRRHMKGDRGLGPRLWDPRIKGFVSREIRQPVLSLLVPALGSSALVCKTSPAFSAIQYISSFASHFI